MTPWPSGNISRQASKGRRFESQSGRNFFALFFKVSQIFEKTTFLGVKKHEVHESGVKKFIRSLKPFKMKKFVRLRKFSKIRHFKGF